MKTMKLIPLYLLTFFDHVSLNIIAPAFVFIFFDPHSHLFPPDTSHAVRSFWFGACLTINNIAGVITSPVLGDLADRWGRKLLLFVGALGALITGVAGTISILIGSILLFFIGRLLAGLCTRTEPIALAVVGDIAHGKEKIIHMSYLQLAITSGAFLGPVLGGYFAQSFFNSLNFTMPFFLATGFALVAILLILFSFQESLTHEKRSTQWKGLFTKEVKIILLFLLLTQFTWSSYYQFIPVVLKISLNFSPKAIGFFIGLIAFWLALTCIVIIPRLVKFFTEIQLLKSACWTLLIGSIITAITLHFIWLTAIVIAVSDMIAYSVIITLLSKAVNQQHQGKIMGLVYFTALSMWSLTSFLGGFLTGINPTLPLYCAPLGVLMICLLMPKLGDYFYELRH